MIGHYRLPRMIERGASVTLTLPVFADDGTSAQTATSGTVSVYDGSAAIVEDQSVTVGPPASYTLAARRRPTAGSRIVSWRSGSSRSAARSTR